MELGKYWSTLVDDWVDILRDRGDWLVVVDSKGRMFYTDWRELLDEETAILA